MRSYPSYVAGLAYPTADGQSRQRYAAKRLRPGDILDMVPEPENPHDENAVAFRHHGFHLGYVPARHSWIGRSLAEGDTVEARVIGLDTEKDGWFSRKVTKIDVRITILKDG